MSFRVHRIGLWCYGTDRHRTVNKNVHLSNDRPWARSCGMHWETLLCSYGQCLHKLVSLCSQTELILSSGGGGPKFVIITAIFSDVAQLNLKAKTETQQESKKVITTNVFCHKTQSINNFIQHQSNECWVKDLILYRNISGSPLGCVSNYTRSQMGWLKLSLFMLWAANYRTRSMVHKIAKQYHRGMERNPWNTVPETNWNTVTETKICVG